MNRPQVLAYPVAQVEQNVDAKAVASVFPQHLQSVWTAGNGIIAGIQPELLKSALEKGIPLLSRVIFDETLFEAFANDLREQTRQIPWTATELLAIQTALLRSLAEVEAHRWNAFRQNVGTGIASAQPDFATFFGCCKAVTGYRQAGTC